MSVPLIVVSTFRLKEGKLEEFKRYYRRIIAIIEANEPQIIAFHGFMNEEGTEMASIQVHPDTASMEFHMQVLRNNWDASFSEYSQMLEAISVSYFGTPAESALQMDLGGSWLLSVKSQHVAGFTRSAASQTESRS